MNRASLGVVVLATGVVACASASIEGGSIVAPDAIPRGVVVGRWTIDDCRDRNHALAPGPNGKVQLLQMLDGKYLLVETRPGSDALIVENQSSNEGERVFQVALTAEHRLVLREYRVSPAGGGFGRLSLVSHVSEWVRPSPGQFAASYVNPSILCGLFPVR